ncbi:MAG TPA: VanZ family protein [Pyrinomonadaceae bacterium]|nr:VanZ family protein [Pyrinomonadaceae bacterium]
MSKPAAIDQAENSSVAKRFVRYAPLVVWMGVIFFASTSGFSADNTSRFIRPLLRWLFPKRSEAELDVFHFLIRKTGHFLGYAVLGFLAHRAFVTSSRSFIRRRWFELALALVVLNALVDELHQSFVPSRTGSIYDSMIDIAGGLTVLLIFKFWRRGNERTANDGADVL